MQRPLATAVVAVVCVLTGVVACGKDDAPKRALNAFLQAWNQGKTEGLVAAEPNGASVPAGDVVNQIKTLSGDLVPGQARLTPSADPVVSGDDATASVDVDWTVAAGVVWHYQTTVRLNHKDDTWRVVWTPQAIHPDLRPGDVLAARAIPSERGQILDGASEAIVKPRPVVVVGIQPNQVTDQAALLASLNSAFASVGVPANLADLPARIAAAKPDAFVDVITLRREAYDRIRGQIRDLPGTVFQETNLHLAPSRAFARSLLGGVGEVTKEKMDANPGKYVVGDMAGQGGLEEQYDTLLRGTSGVRILITGRKTASGGAEAEPELFRAEPKAGEPIRTTLDQKTQNAADAALAGRPNRSAIVAIRIQDGAVLAAANGPDGGDVNLAFTAAVPPGSTFKMVTALGLLDKGAVGIDSIVDCPRTFTVDGRAFHNDNNFELGSVPFRVDFAKSCNTAFASLAPKLGPDGLKNAAGSLGIGTAWNVGTEANTGSVAANASNIEAAAAAFGQGTTQVSPLALAAATAAVARGSWQQPKLFTQMPPGAPGPSPGAATTPDGAALNATSVAALRTLMREVVTVGTATALADVPGQPVHAKTGTAEFDDNPANAHAWTIGWYGDIAFAVFVEKGGSSAATAVPIVESFLRAL
jgi:cell division protein FtsI/penicillin-binding protein 2